ncbi:MAG: CbtA family protein [Geminicoccaceae bacterium]
MALFRSLVFAAALAGLLTGVLVTLAQQMGVVPLILAAEVFEGAEVPGPASEPAASAAHDHGDHDHEAWAPQDGLERTMFTLVANILTGTGFALLLTAAFALRGHAIGWRQGLFWGLAGFAVFMIAPAIGLPPELPGMPAAPLLPRQLWWIATVLATAVGLGLLVFRASPLWAVVAVGLMIAPHLVGAPQPEDAATAVPEELHHRFVVAVTVTSFLFWVALGVSSAWFFERFRSDRTQAA